METKQLAAEGGGTAQIAARDAAELVWDNTMRQEADYVDTIAQGNVVIITSAGFTATDIQRTPHAAPAKPVGQRFISTQQSGTVIFTCDPVPSSESYVAVLSTDAAALDITVAGTQLMIELPAPNSEPAPLAPPPPVPTPVSNVLLVIDASKERKKTITGLESGKRIHAKMYCFNSAGRGIDSDAISIMVG